MRSTFLWIANGNLWNKGLIRWDSTGTCLLLICPYSSQAYCMLTASHYHSNWEWLPPMPKIETSSFSISSIDMLSLQAGFRAVTLCRRGLSSCKALHIHLRIIVIIPVVYKFCMISNNTCIIVTCREGC